MSEADPLDTRASCDAARTEDNCCATSDALYNAASEMMDRGDCPRLFTNEAEHAALLIFGVLAELYTARTRIKELEAEISAAGGSLAKTGSH